MSNKMIEKIDELSSRNKNDDGSSVAFFELREILDADDSQQKIEHLENRIAELESKFSEVFTVKDEIENKLQKIADDNHLVLQELKKRIDYIEKFNKDKLDQTMIKFEHVLNYVDSIDFELQRLENRFAKLEQTVHFDKEDAKVEVPELPNALDVERIEFLLLWCRYHEKYNIALSHTDADEFFKEVCLIFRGEK